jgi:hypothetical protein
VIALVGEDEIGMTDFGEMAGLGHGVACEL